MYSIHVLPVKGKDIFFNQAAQAAKSGRVPIPSGKPLLVRAAGNSRVSFFFDISNGKYAASTHGTFSIQSIIYNAFFNPILK